MLTTPGTRLVWGDLAGWIDAALTLERRDLSHGCRATTLAMRAHWEALPLGWLDQADADVAADFLEMLRPHRPVRSPWESPRRGQRGGTKWERANVAIRNRIARLAQAADRASMDLGHNSRRTL